MNAFPRLPFSQRKNQSSWIGYLPDIICYIYKHTYTLCKVSDNMLLHTGAVLCPLPCDLFVVLSCRGTSSHCGVYRTTYLILGSRQSRLPWLSWVVFSSSPATEHSHRLIKRMLVWRSLKPAQVYPPSYSLPQHSSGGSHCSPAYILLPAVLHFPLSGVGLPCEESIFATNYSGVPEGRTSNVLQ